MPTARRKVTVTAPRDAWKRLGELLTDRRKDLGYTYRVPFDKVSNVNQRMQADIEMAAKARVDHFTDGSLRKIARGYQVTYGSMLAVLRGEADVLTPAPPAAVQPCLLLTTRPAGRLSALQRIAATTTRSTSAASPSPPRAFSTRPARRCSPAPPTTRRYGTASAGGCPSVTGCGSSRTCAAGKPAGSRTPARTPPGRNIAASSHVIGYGIHSA